MPAQRGPVGAVRDVLPGACERARLHRAGGAGGLRRRRADDPQGQSVPHRVRLGVRASLRATLPPHAHRRAAQHPRHQGVRLRARARRPGARAEASARNRPPRGGRWRRPVRFDLRVLRRLDGPRRGRVRGAQAAGRHDPLRHPRVPLPARAPGRGYSRHPGRGRHHRAYRKPRGRRAHGAAFRGLRRRVRGHRRANRQGPAHRRHGCRGRVFRR